MNPVRLALVAVVVSSCPTALSVRAQDTSGAPASELGQFLRWWKSQLWTANKTPPPPGIRRDWLRFQQLTPCTDCRVRASDVPGHIPVRAFRLFSQGSAGEAILLVPMDSTTDASWLLARPSGGITTLPLSFAATQDAYGPDEVDFYLYWLPDRRWPLVELITNAPACVPATLYLYDAQIARYRVLRRECGG